MAGSITRRSAAVLVLALAILGLNRQSPAAAEPWSDVIREVRLEGGAWRWRGDLADSLGLKVGNRYRGEDAIRSVNLLMATGDFRSVDVAATFSAEGVGIVFELQAKELVGDLEVNGNYYLLKKEILSVVKTSLGEELASDVLATDRSRIEALYSRRGFFGTTVTADAKPMGSGRISAVFSINEGEPGVIQGVDFAGNKAVSRDELDRWHSLLALSYYEPEEIETAAEKLISAYRRRGFIEAKVVPEVNMRLGVSFPSLSLLQPLKSVSSLVPGRYQGVDILFRIKEGEPFDIGFEGNHEISDDSIRDLISFIRTGFFDRYEVEESRNEILAYYRNHGFFHAAVSAVFDPTLRRVFFNIKEGPRVTINRIAFRGNTALSGRQLRRMMDSAPGFAGGRTFNAEALKRDLNAIKAWYVSHGYTAMTMDSVAMVFPEAPNRMEIHITVNEGTRTRLGQVRFVGANAVDVPSLERAAGRKSGDVFDPDWVAKAKRAILDLHARKGFAQCAVNADIDFSADGALADVTFRLVEGRSFVLGRVLAQGNHRTRSRIVTREIALASGEPYDPVTIYEGQRRLYELGLFARVDMVTPPSPDEVADLIVKVREKPTTMFSLGLGYDSEEAYRAYVELGEDNLFGTGRGIRLRYRFSAVGSRYEIIYKEPWLFGFRHDANLNLYNEYREEVGYDISRMGIKLFSDNLLADYLNLYVAYRYESVDYHDIRPALLTKDLEEEFIIGSLRFRLSYDRRDNAVNPHRGFTVGFGLEGAHGILGSEAQFNKFELQAAYVQPLFTGSELVASFRLGTAEKILAGDELPLSERFFAGGAGTVRGFEERKLGPGDAEGNPVGGDFLLLGNLEWRFRIYRSLGGVVFLDAGNVWSRRTEVNLGDIRESIGAGIRYDTPVGPARLEYGYQLNPEAGENRYRVHFTLGHPF